MHKGKPFTDLLGEIEGGRLLEELTAATYEVVAAVMDTRKAGKIKLGIEIAPTGKATVRVDGTFTTTVPEHDRQSTTFFVDGQHTLLRDDPRQEPLPLRIVPDGEQADPIKVGE